MTWFNILVTEECAKYCLVERENDCDCLVIFSSFSIGCLRMQLVACSREAGRSTYHTVTKKILCQCLPVIQKFEILSHDMRCCPNCPSFILHSVAPSRQRHVWPSALDHVHKQTHIWEQQPPVLFIVSSNSPSDTTLTLAIPQTLCYDFTRLFLGLKTQPATLQGAK